MKGLYGDEHWGSEKQEIWVKNPSSEVLGLSKAPADPNGFIFGEELSWFSKEVQHKSLPVFNLVFQTAQIYC